MVGIMILLIILIILCVFLLVAIIYMYDRNDKVYRYRISLSERCYQKAQRDARGCKVTDIWNAIMDKHSYDDMLVSIKPLRDEYWFTEEELKMLEE